MNGNVDTGTGSAMTMKRTRNSNWRAALGLLALLLSLQVTAACLGPAGRLLGNVATETPINRLERGMLDATDLPFGWRRESSGVPQDLRGGFARYRDYRGPGDSPIFVRAGQSIALYASEADSDAAYQTAARENIPPGYEDQWPRPPELDVPTQADAVSIGCRVGVFNGIPARTCVVVVRYGKLVTTIDAQVFEDRWLTIEQFRTLLERLDVKMAAIRGPDESETPTPTQ